jgi:hypothetical protein
VGARDHFGTLIENLMQVCLYALALELEGVKVNYVRVHYVHRDDFDESFERHTYPWDDRMRAVAEQALVELAGRQGQLDIAEITGELPERDRLGPTDGLCRHCDFLEVCWNVPRAEELGMTPEKLTLLGEEPDDAAIEHACSRIIAKREEIEAKKREVAELQREYKALNNMIDRSVPERDYGLVRVRRNGGGNKILFAQWVPQLFEWAAREKGVDLAEAGDPPRSAPGLPIAELVPAGQQRKKTRSRKQVPETRDGGAA